MNFKSNIPVINAFELKNKKCIYLEEISYDKNGNKYLTFRVKATDKEIKFMFNKELLCEDVPVKLKKDILFEFVSIRDGDVEKMKKFFETYGFILPLTNEYHRYSVNKVFNVKKKLEYLMDIINEVNLGSDSNNFDLYKLIDRTLSLILMKPIKMVNYESYEYEFYKYLFDEQVKGINIRTELMEYFNAWYVNTENCDEFKNKITNELGDLSTDEYRDNHLILYTARFISVMEEFENQDLLNGYKELEEITKLIAKAIKKLKKIDIRIDEESLYKNKLVLKMDINGNYELVDNNFQLNKLIERKIENNTATRKTRIFKYVDPNILEELKILFLKLAKLVVDVELNFNIKNISPKYDAINLTQAWKVPTLLSAMYFSLFYLDTKFNIIYKCQNPNCNKYFKLAKSKEKKYCSRKCANAMSQRRWRERSM